MVNEVLGKAAGLCSKLEKDARVSKALKKNNEEKSKLRNTYHGEGVAEILDLEDGVQGCTSSEPPGCTPGELGRKLASHLRSKGS